MTVLTDTQVVTASGGLVELGYSQITGAVAIGTAVTQLIPATGNLTCVCDGSPVIIDVFYPYISTSAGANTRIGITVDGVQNQLGICSPNAFIPGRFSYRLTPTAGSHTFSAYAWADVAGTAGAGPASGSGAYVPAFLSVSKIVSATQWPAVTTGSIICTSSTRPASPFVGQQIYETDTRRSWTYITAAWVPDDGIYATEATRNAAIPTPSEGQQAYITGSTIAAATGVTTAVPTGIRCIHNGSSTPTLAANWVCVTPVGATTNTVGTSTSTAFTPTLTSGGTNPSVTIVTGTTALVTQTAVLANNTAGQGAYMTVAVSGATTLAPSSDLALYNGGTASAYLAASATVIITGLTAGTNTFTLQYKAGGSGTIAVGQRQLIVQGIA